MNEKDLKTNLLMKMASAKLKKNDMEIKDALKSNNLNSLLGNMNQNESEKIKNILNDPDKMKKIVSSEQFQKLFNSFTDK